MATIYETFWDWVDTAEPDGCWPWMRARLPERTTRRGGGYGSVTVDGVQTGAHRVAYELSKGEIPRGMIVMHTCDNPPCCNPTHLQVGTHADNRRDRAAKGRNGRTTNLIIKRGTQLATARLTEAKVIEIRNIYATGDSSIPRLAVQYGVAETTIWQVLHRQTWSHI